MRGRIFQRFCSPLRAAEEIIFSNKISALILFVIMFVFPGENLPGKQPASLQDLYVNLCQGKGIFILLGTFTVQTLLPNDIFGLVTVMKKN